MSSLGHSRARVKLVLLIGLALAGVGFARGIAPMAQAAPGLQSTPTLTLVSATPTPAASRTLRPGDEIYTVEQGDTLWSIAVKFYGNGTKLTAILRANNLSDNAILRVGTTLIIPSLADQTPTPAKSLVAVTPTLLSIQATLPAPTLAPTTQLPASTSPAQETSTVPIMTPTAAPAPADTRSIDPSVMPFMPLVVAVLNVIGVLCLLGSLLCAYLAYNSYKRALFFEKRRIMAMRIREGL